MSLTISTVLAMLVSMSVSGPSLTMHIAPTSVSAVSSYETGKMIGSVVTQDGKPIAEAMVAVYAEGSIVPLMKTRTGTNGSFSLAAPPASGTYTVHVLRVGFLPVIVPLVQQGNSWSLPAQITMKPISTDALSTPEGEAVSN